VLIFNKEEKEKGRCRMKKILASLLVLAMVAPAMAAVTVGLVDNEDGTGTITMDTGGDVVRGVALTVTCGGDAKLVDLSFTANAEFNTFIDYFAVNGTGGVAGETPAQEGHPYAAAGTTAGVAAIDATEFVVSMGVLDELEGQAGYTGSGDLITINLVDVDNGSGEVCISLDTVRGGIVGDVALTTNIDSAPVCETITNPIVITECVKSDAPFYADWVGAGKNWEKPDCWCYQYNCRGDADGLKIGLFRVNSTDLGLFAQAYNLGDLKMDQTKICSDFDHLKVGLFRVNSADLGILAANYNKGDLKISPCTLDWDGDLDDDYNFWTAP